MVSDILSLILSWRTIYERGSDDTIIMNSFLLLKHDLFEPHG